MKVFKKILILSILATSLLVSCGGDKSEKKPEEAAKFDPMTDLGIGPVSFVILDSTVNKKMASEGKEIYSAKCYSCHKETVKYIGPAPIGILKRRTPEWVMNMILNPTEMVAKDPIAKDLLKQFSSPMANQNLTQDDARKVLEYFRTIEESQK